MFAESLLSWPMRLHVYALPHRSEYGRARAADEARPHRFGGNRKYDECLGRRSLGRENRWRVAAAHKDHRRSAERPAAAPRGRLKRA